MSEVERMPWDGFPSEPDKAGWHLLRRKYSKFLHAHEIDTEEVYYFNPRAELVWMRRENGVRHGFRPEHIIRDWDYVGQMELIA